MPITPGPNWEMIALAAIGVLVAMIGGYAKGVSERVNKLEEAHNRLEKSILKEYHNKIEIRDLLSELRKSLTALHERFDRAGFPHTYENKGEGSD